MSFVSRFLAGSAAAAGVSLVNYSLGARSAAASLALAHTGVLQLTYYYHININAEASRLSAQLHALSEQLVASAPRAEPPVSFETPIPRRAGLKEEVKARVSAASATIALSG